jgi:hypothetical protein
MCSRSILSSSIPFQEITQTKSKLTKFTTIKDTNRNKTERKEKQITGKDESSGSSQESEEGGSLISAKSRRHLSTWIEESLDRSDP